MKTRSKTAISNILQHKNRNPEYTFSVVEGDDVSKRKDIQELVVFQLLNLDITKKTSPLSQEDKDSLQSSLKRFQKGLPIKVKEDGYFFGSLDDKNGKSIAAFGAYIVPRIDKNGRAYNALEVQHIVVDKELRGQGVFKQLLAEMTEYSIKNQCQKIEFSVSLGSFRRSNGSIYHKTGFNLAGIRYSKGTEEQQNTPEDIKKRSKSIADNLTQLKDLLYKTKEEIFGSDKQNNNDSLLTKLRKKATLTFNKISTKIGNIAAIYAPKNNEKFYKDSTFIIRDYSLHAYNMQSNPKSSRDGKTADELVSNAKNNGHYAVFYNTDSPKSAINVVNKGFSTGGSVRFELDVTNPKNKLGQRMDINKAIIQTEYVSKFANKVAKSQEAKIESAR